MSNHPRIIGLSGLAGAGKDTAAGILHEHFGYAPLSFAHRLKEGVASIFGYDRSMLSGNSEESRVWRESPDKYFSDKMGKEITPRKILQIVGTECLRNGFHEDVWVMLLERELKKFENQCFVVSDVRFPNEQKMLRSLGAELWEIRPPILPEWVETFKKDGKVPENIHVTESSWMSEKFDYCIINDISNGLIPFKQSIHRTLTKQ